jgi:hypothetical protein
LSYYFRNMFIPLRVGYCLSLASKTCKFSSTNNYPMTIVVKPQEIPLKSQLCLVMLCRSKPVPYIIAGRHELLLADGQQDTIHLIVAFRNSANAHKTTLYAKWTSLLFMSGSLQATWQHFFLLSKYQEVWTVPDFRQRRFDGSK